MKKLILFFAAVCCAAMMQAEQIYNVKYIDDKGIEQTCPSANVVTSILSAKWEAGWYVVYSSRVIPEGVICNGAVHLILEDGSQLTVEVGTGKAGIEVSGEGNSLTIYGQTAQSGQLIATGGEFGAGIGGGNDGSGSYITINGGTVTANGGNSAAGIGGGNDGSGSYITINGGTVTAKGGNSAAGIGGGYWGSGSNITINGGTVTANGGQNAAGIGSGISDVESNKIFVADGVKVVANESVIAHTSSKDIASDLADKGYVTAFELAPFIKAIDDAVGGSTDKTITGIANTAKASVLVQTTADRAKTVSDLAVAKINAIKEILKLIGDDANARNTEFISNIISDIVSAVSVNDVTTTKTQALIVIPAFQQGRSSAFGPLGEKQTGPAIEVTDQDNNSVILYSPKKVNFIKVTGNNQD